MSIQPDRHLVHILDPFHADLISDQIRALDTSGLLIPRVLSEARVSGQNLPWLSRSALLITEHLSLPADRFSTPRLVTRIHEVLPGYPIAVVTISMEEAQREHQYRKRNIPVIAKPHSMDDIATTLRRARLFWANYNLQPQAKRILGQLRQPAVLV